MLDIIEDNLGERRGVAVLSRKRWESLPADLQTIVMGDPADLAKKGRRGVRAIGPMLEQSFVDAGPRQVPREHDRPGQGAVRQDQERALTMPPAPFEGFVFPPTGNASRSSRMGDIAGVTSAIHGLYLREPGHD